MSWMLSDRNANKRDKSMADNVGFRVEQLLAALARRQPFTEAEADLSTALTDYMIRSSYAPKAKEDERNGTVQPRQNK